jgi:hypothetical protein
MDSGEEWGSGVAEFGILEYWKIEKWELVLKTFLKIVCK